MKIEKLNLFKLINVCIVVFCIVIVFMNSIGVKVIDADTATSSINGIKFEYETMEDSIIFKKEGEWVGSLPTNKKLSNKK